MIENVIFCFFTTLLWEFNIKLLNDLKKKLFNSILLKDFQILLVKHAVIITNMNHYTLSVLISTVKQIYCYPSGPVTIG